MTTLVEDQQHVVLGAGGAQALEEALLRGGAPLQGFDDDGGEVAGMLGDDPRREGTVVVGGDEDVVGRRRWNAGARGVGAGKVEEAVGEQARDPGLVGAVVGALELEDHAPPGRGPREPLAVHGGLGAGGAEAQPIAGGADPADLLRKRQGVLVHAGEVRPERRLAHDRLGHLGPGVSHQHGTPAHGEVEEGGAGHVLDLASRAPGDHRAELGGEIEFAVGAGGEHLQRSLCGRVHVRFGHGVILTANKAVPAVSSRWILPGCACCKVY